MEDCLFCQIVGGQIPSKIRFEDEQVVAFDDIHPKAPVHILIVPRQHLASLAQAENDDQALLGHLLLVAKQLASDLKLPGYRIQINTGREGGQVIDHLHLHLMGGKTFAA